MNRLNMVTRKSIVLTILLLYFLQVSAQTFPELETSEEGFVAIFDGKSLKNWQGDPKYWSVKEGAIVGEVTPENILKENSFLIYKDSLNDDFELKVLFRVSEKGNSGINYRSIRVPNKPYALKGYQADIDGQNMWTGQNYEERGRTFLALRGQMTSVQTDSFPRIEATLGNKQTMKSHINNNDWNEYHLIVSGNMMTHIINGRLMSMVIDNDTNTRRFSGLLGVQVHVGPPMKIEYKGFRIKN